MSMLLRRAAAALIAVAAAGPVLAAAGSDIAASSDIHPGDHVTQTAVFSYAFAAPQPGDWVRYRLGVGNTTFERTLGFGSEQVGDKKLLFIESREASTAVINAPVPTSKQIGGDIVSRTYVDASALGDPAQTYSVVATVFKVGDALYRIDYRAKQPAAVAANGPPQRYDLLGSLPFRDPRTGVVSIVEPQTLDLASRKLAATHVVAQFPAARIPGGGSVPVLLLEVWQSSDVPLGTVRYRATVSGKTIALDLIDFGRGNYHPVIDKPLDSIQPLSGSTAPPR